jgi:hypothetical protein
MKGFLMFHLRVVPSIGVFIWCSSLPGMRTHFYENIYVFFVYMWGKVHVFYLTLY